MRRDPEAAPRSRALEWVIGGGVTLLLHIGILVSIFALRYFEGSASSRPLLAEGHVVDVQAVRFGKPRDLSFLPHKERIAVNKGPKPKIALTENEKALPHLKDDKEQKPDVVDPLHTEHSKLFENVTDDEQKGADVGEGDPNGVKGGTALVGKGPVYLQHLVAAVQNAWSVPKTISDERLAKLKAQACMKIDAAGKLSNIAIKTSSGDGDFDATLMNALNSITNFEAPTDDVKEMVAGGVCMNFKYEKSL